MGAQLLTNFKGLRNLMAQQDTIGKRVLQGSPDLIPVGGLPDHHSGSDQQFQLLLNFRTSRMNDQEGGWFLIGKNQRNGGYQGFRFGLRLRPR